MGIIIKRISTAPIYHTRWQHRLLYNNTNNKHEMETDRQTDRQRQRDRAIQRYRNRDRQTDRQTQTEERKRKGQKGTMLTGQTKQEPDQAQKHSTNSEQVWPKTAT